MNGLAYPFKKLMYCPACGAPTFKPKKIDKSPTGQLKTKQFGCTTCGFEFFRNAAASTMAVIMKDEDTILMIRRAREPAKGTLDLPGGFVDPGERSEIAMIREVYEETNLHVSSYEVHPKTYCNEYLFGGVLYDTLDIVYICRVKNWDDLRSNDPEEGEPLLIKLDELDPKEVGLDSVRRFVTDFLHSRG